MLQKVAHCLKLPSFVVHLQHEQTWTPKQGNLVCTTFARKWSALRYSCFSGLCWPPKCVRSEKLRDLEAVCYQRALYWPIGSIVLWNIPWIMHKIAGIECRTIGRRYTHWRVFSFANGASWVMVRTRVSISCCFKKLRQSPAASLTASGPALDSLWRICLLTAGNENVAAQSMKDILAVVMWTIVCRFWTDADWQNRWLSLMKQHRCIHDSGLIVRQKHGTSKQVSLSLCLGGFCINIFSVRVERDKFSIHFRNFAKMTLGVINLC